MCIYVFLIETKIIYVISIEFKYENLYEWGGGLKANKNLLDFPKLGMQVFCHVYSYYYITYLSWTYFYFITNQEKNISVHQEFVSHKKQLLKLCYERIVNLIIHYNIKRITSHFTLKSLS